MTVYYRTNEKNWNELFLQLEKSGFEIRTNNFNQGYASITINDVMYNILEVKFEGLTITRYIKEQKPKYIVSANNVYLQSSYSIKIPMYTEFIHTQNWMLEFLIDDSMRTHCPLNGGGRLNV